MGGTGVALVSCGTAFAADDSAVSGPTLTVDGSAGSVGGAPSGYLGAMGTVPVGHHFGAQMDVAVGQSDERGQGGAGGHFFWRDPEVGLAGATAMWSRIGGWNIYRYGLETEAYLGDFTLAPSGGVQRGDANQGTTGYGTLIASWYADDDLKMSLGGTGFSNVRSGFAGVEWQPDRAVPLSLYAEAGGGNRGHGFALAGVRFAFGAGESSLKDRHRHGDPVNIVSYTNANGSGGALAAQAQAIQENRAVITPVSVPATCFIAGTEVLMADGSIKAIETVEIGEILLGADGSPNAVLAFDHPLLGDRKLYSFNQGPHFVTAEHPFMTTQGWKSIDPVATERENVPLTVTALELGDALVTNADTVILTSIDATEADPATRLFNFRLAGNSTYFVREPGTTGSFFLVHNK